MGLQVTLPVAFSFSTRAGLWFVVAGPGVLMVREKPLESQRRPLAGLTVCTCCCSPNTPLMAPVLTFHAVKAS